MKKIGNKWQQKWAEAKVYERDPDPKKPSYFATFPYPYVNGSVHLGHGYTIMKVDAMIRYKRMKGFNAWFPQGFHATGEPIVGQAKRVKARDKIALFTLKKFGVKDEDIPKFEDPTYMARYFVDLMRKDLKSVGLGIDWRAEFVTTDLTPTYSKFITWQYLRLRDLGFVGKGTHPVIYCPSCRSPTGDHDRLEGEGVSVTEMKVIIFGPDSKGYYYPCATLRPETIFGVTNIFMKPGEEYVVAEYNGMKLVMSEEALFKFQEQLVDMKKIGTVKADELFHEKVKVPIINTEVPILPGTFISMDFGTAVVMSVPAHAPFDWAALKALGEKTGIDTIRINGTEIQAIPIIQTPGFPELSAVEFVDKDNLTVDKEKELESLTKQVYKKELNKGRMYKNLPIVGGKPVKIARDEIGEYLEDIGKAIKLYETEEPVVCRCGTKNYVKVLKEQWFLKYSLEEWKEKARKAVAKMKFYPEEVRKQFEATIEWLEDKACTRKSGLGTRLPWDKNWIIETLSDSTIYMAYYPIQKFVHAGKVKAENLIPEVFDYVYTGKGDLDELKKKSGLTKKVLKEMRKEFDYWYPMDLRRSGKDLIQNHLTFSIFHHVALFPEEKWPLAFSVNGMMQFEGQRMSKSKGVLTPLSESVEYFGADLVRLGLLGAGEGIDDANFREADVNSYASRLEKLNQLIETLDDIDQEWLPIDYWLQSRLQRSLKKINEAFENILTRTVTIELMHGLMNDFRWYERRRGKLGPVTKEFVTTMIKALTPLTPHFSEEMWRKLGHDSFIIDEAYPQANEELINEDIERTEEFLMKTYDDVNEILKVMGKHSPKELHLIVADKWKYEVLQLINEQGGKAMGVIAKDSRFKENQKRALQLAKQFMKDKSLKNPLTQEQEYQALKDLSVLLENTYGFKVEIHKAEETELEKKNLAIPMRPGIQFK